jgi:hypothetical protein
MVPEYELQSLKNDQRNEEVELEVERSRGRGGAQPSPKGSRGGFWTAFRLLLDWAT